MTAPSSNDPNPVPSADSAQAPARQDVRAQVLDALRWRAATKRYDPDRSVSPEDLSTILEAAHLSPSSMGLEPWRFLVADRVRDADLLRELHPVCWGAQRSFEGASHIVFALARRAADVRGESEYVHRTMHEVHGFPAEMADARQERLVSFQRHDFDLTDDRKLFDWSCKQVYIALGDMLMAAALLRVDSCPIEGFDRAAAEDVLERRGLLDRAHFGLAVMASFGYRGAEPRPKTRRPLDEVVGFVS